MKTSFQKFEIEYNEPEIPDHLLPEIRMQMHLYLCQLTMVN